MIRTVLTSSMVIFFAQVLYSQSNDSVMYQSDAVTVTATRIPTNELFVNRTVDVINRKTMHEMGAVSIEDALQNSANVDIQSRGIFGVQTDASIRGSLFSQNLILLNGVRLNDVQTGHHNFDLPISVKQIDRIEVLKGAGSALYGADAFGGIINIITHAPDLQSLSVNLSGGNYGLVNVSAGYNFSTGGVHSSTMLEQRQSTGFQYDTDFRILTIASNNEFQSAGGTYSLLGGYTKKEFGAYGYYGPAPSKEWTETSFLSGGADYLLGAIQVQPKFSYRRHHDKFMYDIRTPDRYVNIHTSSSYTAEVQSFFKLNEQSSLVTNIEGNENSIASSNLNSHARSSLGVSASYHSALGDNFPFDVSVREDVHSVYGNQFSPAINIGYVIPSSTKVYASVGRSFRAPTYTELYYFSKTRIGNPNLQPETGWSYEVGGEIFPLEEMKLTTAVFLRSQKNLIDYVLFTPSDTAYSAANFATASTHGLEVSLQWHRQHHPTNGFGVLSASLWYTYLDSHIELGGIYKTLYSFLHPRHQISGLLAGSLPFTLDWTADVTHKIKLDGTAYTLMSAKLSRSFSSSEIFLQGNNLFNQSYEEIAGVPLPGRWLWAGFEYHIL